MALYDYTITFADSAYDDQVELKQYIIDHFYPEYGESFDSKMRSAAKVIKNSASSIRPTSFLYRGYVIYMLVHMTYLFFYVVNEDNKTITILRVLNEGRDWMKIINKWLDEI